MIQVVHSLCNRDNCIVRGAGSFAEEVSNIRGHFDQKDCHCSEPLFNITSGPCRECSVMINITSHAAFDCMCVGAGGGDYVT